MKDLFNVSIDTRVLIKEKNIKTNEIKTLVDKSNAIHTQNMARVIARGLAREENYFIKRIAFGNGGSSIDAVGNVILNTPNDTGWEARLYNETYSEIVDELNADLGQDPGSAEPGNIRPGGGASPGDDPEGAGVRSEEIGTRSNVNVVMYINNNEPDGQIGTQAELGPTLEENERCFSFDELGFYSPGKPATATNGYSSADCGGALSTTELPATISPNTVYNLPIEIDGVSYTTVITTPASGSGSLGALTYGDLCEGINTGSWITGGDDISDLIYVYITDRSSGVYPTILNKQSYGFIIFQSLTTGSTSSVELICEALATNLFYQLSEEVCGNVNVNQYVGEDAGVANDALNPENERERLLTHLTFTPIVKTSDRVLIIDYTLTVSVSRTNDSSTNITNNT